MRILETDRLLLRPFDLEKDLEAYAAILGEDEVGKWLPKGSGYTREEAERFIRFWNSHWDTYNYGTWAVIDKLSGELYGHCGLNTVKDLSEVEVLYALGFNGRDKGIGTEAAKASLAYAFNEVGLKRIIALAKPANLPSINVMTKNGLSYEKDVHLWNIDLALYSKNT